MLNCGVKLGLLYWEFTRIDKTLSTQVTISLSLWSFPISNYSVYKHSECVGRVEIQIEI